MRQATRRWIAVLVIAGASSWSGTSARAEAPALHERVATMLAKLSPELRARCALPFDHGNRKVWTFLPGRRMGVSLREMAAPARAAVMDVLKSALSAEGWTKVQGIFTVEQVLRDGLSAARKRMSPGWRDPLGYYVTVFGTPGAKGRFGLRIGGHHLSLNLTFRDGKATCAPFFFGASPAVVPRGKHKGLQPLRDQEVQARELVRSLSAELRKKAVVSTRVPGGIFLGPNRTKRDAKAAGINIMDFSESQLAQFWGVVSTYGHMLSKDIQSRTLRPAELSDPHKVWFVWMGSTEPGRDHYYRIWGPTFAIEYWNQGNHIHSVWRDTAEFGG